MADVNAGKLTFDVSADLDKLDAALRKAKSKLDDVDKPIEVEVDVEVDNSKADAALGGTKSKLLDLGTGAEATQQKIGKVLGVIGGFVAAVQVIGGVGTAMRNLGRESAGLLSEAEASKSALRNFSETIPIIGAVGIAFEDLAIGIGLVEDEVAKVEARLMAAENAAKRFQQALTGERAVEDFKRQLMELQGASELQILEAGLDPVVDALDDQIRTVEDTLREAENELNRLSASGAGFGDNPELDQQFDEQLAVIKQLKRDLQELANLRPQILDEREATLRGQEIEETQKKRAAQALEQAKIEQEATDKLVQMQEEADQKILDNLKAQEELKEKARKIQKENAEAELEGAKQLLALRGKDIKTLEKRRSLAEKELETIKKQQESTRQRLGETESITSAIGNFVVGRSFGASAGQQTNPEKKQEQELQEINSQISTTNEILRTIQERGGLTGALT
jgi:DNA repair exonuclease SbcCD ATPase subunit